jgi:hypothetical protein
MIDEKNVLLATVNDICSQRYGFRVYRHSDQNNFREHRLTFLCQYYSNSRCPFMLCYKKDADQQYFQLLKYRVEHNHAIHNGGSVQVVVK